MEFLFKIYFKQFLSGKIIININIVHYIIIKLKFILLNSLI